MTSSKQILFAAIAFFAFPLAAIIALSSSQNITISPFSLRTVTTTQVTTSVTVPNQAAPSFSTGLGLNLPTIYVPYIGISLQEILAVVAVILLGLFFSRYVTIVRLRSRKAGDGQSEFIDPLEEKRKAVSSLLESASSNLARDSTKFRQIVLECYRLILELLEDKSAISGRNLTAREFKEIVSRALSFDSGALQEVTNLFELAKYSQREITKEQALEAAKCLRELSRELAEKSTLESIKP